MNDAEGNPIRGLDASHFTVYENDVPHAITNFSEIDHLAAEDESASSVEASGSVIPAKRYVHVFIDEYSINPIQRAKTFDALRAMLDASLVEGDEVAITRWIRRPDLVLPFTSDLTKPGELLTSLRGEGVMGLTFLTRRRQTARNIESYGASDSTLQSGVGLGAALAEADYYRDEIADNLRNLAADLAMSISMMGGLEGRKLLIFVGDNLPLEPGLEMVEAARQAFGRAAVDQEIAKFGTFAGTTSRSIELIARAANAHGVTVYSLSPGLRLTSQDGAMFHDALNLGAISFTTFRNSADSFEQIARATGGAVTLDPGTLDRVLGRLAADLRSYYSVGFRPGAAGKRARSIRVAVHVPGAVVRARDTLVVRTAEEDLAASALTCLLQQQCESDFALEVKIGEPRRIKRNLYSVPLEVLIPMRALTLVRTDEGSLAGFMVHVSAVTQDGELSEGTIRGQRVRLAPAEASTAGDRQVKWGIELEARRGTTRLVVAVADEVSLLVGFAKTELVVRK